MPVKNAAPFLEKCLQSIKAQDRSQFEFELVAVNDHSDDGTVDILQRWAEENDWMQLLHNDGAGILDALNTGIEQASGNIISRMDADDIMPLEKLQRLYHELVQKGEGHVITGKVKYFRDDKALGNGFVKYEHWLNRLVDNQSFYNEIYRECPIASANWMMYSKDFIACGGGGNTYPEDYDLVFRWRRLGLVVYGVKDCTHLWRDHSNRASRTLEQYRDNAFLDLKLLWFLQELGAMQRSLVLIGAGKKGKKIARYLKANEVNFKWVTNNPNKIGHIIDDVLLEKYTPSSITPQYIALAALAAPQDQISVALDLETQGLKEGKGYYFFA